MKNNSRSVRVHSDLYHAIEDLQFELSYKQKKVVPKKHVQAVVAKFVQNTKHKIVEEECLDKPKRGKPWFDL